MDYPTMTWDELCSYDHERERWVMEERVRKVFKGASRVYAVKLSEGAYQLIAERGLFRPCKDVTVSLSIQEILAAVPPAKGRRNGVPIFFQQS